MKRKFIVAASVVIALAGRASAQEGFPVTEQQPVVIEGLNCGYRIKSLETKKVGDKGDFSRYSISFFVKNISSQPRVLPFRRGMNGMNGMNGVADNLVQFNCLNATGARLTSKYAVIKAPPYNEFRKGRFVPVGYGLAPGQMVSVDEVMIVPLNERLNMMVLYIGYSQQIVPLNAVAATPAPIAVGGPDPNQPPPVFNAQSFYQLKNAFNNSFINVQTGVISSSPIQNGWSSAQWQIMPVPGTNYVKIKNKWKANFIDTERGYITMAVSEQSPGATWFLEPVQGNLFHIQNVQSGQYLCLIAGQIRLTAGNNNPGAGWIIQ